MFTMLSRPLLLVFLFWLLIMVTHFEQRQQIVTEAEANPVVSRRKQRMLDSEEVVKEKVSIYHFVLNGVPFSVGFVESNLLLIMPPLSIKICMFC